MPGRTAELLLPAEGELIGRADRARAGRCRHVTSTVPFPFRETAVVDVAEFTVKLLVFVELNWAAVASVKPVPAMVTVV
jgi:hypothetical protein